MRRIKVVINACYGGFSLSAEAMAWLKGHGLKLDDDDDEEGRDIPRDNPLLVKCVESLDKAANGRFAFLQIVKIPYGTHWEIAKYDGKEHIAECHRTWP